MPIPGFRSLFFTDFRGLITTAKQQDLAPLFSPACQNNGFLPGSCGTRNGTSTKFTLDGGTDVFHMELLILASPFTKYYFFLMEDHKLYWAFTDGVRHLLLTLPTNIIMFKNVPYQNLVGFLAFSDGFIGTTAPYVITPSSATGVLTSDGNTATDGKIVTIGSTVYTLKAALTGAANEILIYPEGQVLQNLKDAINAGPGIGDTYGIGTVRNTEVRATTLDLHYDGSGVIVGSLTVEAILPGAAGNSIATTTDEPAFSWGGATLSGGGTSLNADLMTVAPVSVGTMHANTISPGNITPGKHKLVVIFVTRSGYFSKPTDPIDFNFDAPQATATLTSDATNVADGDTVTIGQQKYTFKTVLSGATTQTSATNVLTNTAAPDDGDTVTIGQYIYVFKTALSGSGDTPFEVLIQAFAGNSLSNLEHAINGAGTPGTEYGAGTPVNDLVTAVDAGNNLTVTAINAGADGNSIQTLEESTKMSWPTATLTGGNDFNPGGVPNEVLIGADAQHSLQDLYEAVTLRGTEGTTYGFGTPLNDLAGSDGLTSATTVVFFAKLGGSAGNLIATLETSAHLSWGGTTMTGGADTLGLLLNDIPVHPDSQVVDRWIAMTQSDLDSYFLMAEIGNNTATFFSTPGVDDLTLGQQLNVDDRFRLQSPLPGAIGMLVYHNRLIMWGDGDNTSILKISLPGDPQAFNEDTGFLEIRRDDGQRIVSAFVMRDFLYIVKERSMHVTSDNGDDPSTWAVNLVAEDVGTETVNGVDVSGDRDFAAILDPKGIYLFTGAPPYKLSNDIDLKGLFPGHGWGWVNENTLDTAEMHVDPVNNLIEAWVPIQSASRPNAMVVANYRDGFDKVKWDCWKTLGTAWRSFVIDGSETVIATASSSVRHFDDTQTSATATLTSDNVNVGAAETVTTDGSAKTVYTFVTVLASAYDVLIGATADDSMNNLIAAINHAAGEGTTYGTGTVANPDVTAGTLVAHAFTVTSIIEGPAGNTIFVSTTSPHLSWDGTTLSGGGIPAVRTDNGVGIDWRYRLGPVAPQPNGMSIFGGLSVHAEGDGPMKTRIYGPDGILAATPADIDLTAAPNKDFFRRLNIRKERVYVEFSQLGENGLGDSHINSISPTSVVPGSGAFTLTVNGSGFTVDSIVRWNGVDRVTTFVSSIQLTAAILASDVETTGTGTVTVFTPDVNCGLFARVNSVLVAARPDGVRVR